MKLLHHNLKIISLHYKHFCRQWDCLWNWIAKKKNHNLWPSSRVEEYAQLWLVFIGVWPLTISMGRVQGHVNTSWTWYRYYIWRVIYIASLVRDAPAWALTLNGHFWWFNLLKWSGWLQQRFLKPKKDNRSSRTSATTFSAVQIS